jgi:hypothetical protein
MLSRRKRIVGEKARSQSRCFSARAMSEDSCRRERVWMYARISVSVAWPERARKKVDQV